MPVDPIEFGRAPDCHRDSDRRIMPECSTSDGLAPPTEEPVPIGERGARTDGETTRRATRISAGAAQRCPSEEPASRIDVVQEMIAEPGAPIDARPGNVK